MNIIKNKFLLSFLVLILLGFVAINFMPKSIDMNLEKIGNGQASVVFIYDPNLAVSNQQVIEINRAREMMGDQVTFLIAQEGDPTSENFRKQHGARSPELLFFDRHGNLFDRRIALISAETFIETISGI